QPVRYIVASPVIVHFVYGDFDALLTLSSVARCVTPTSCPLDGIAVRNTGRDVGLASTISVMALLLFHENARRLVSQFDHADVRRPDTPSPPMIVFTNAPVLNNPLLSYGVASRLKKPETSWIGLTRPLTFTNRMFAPMLLSNGSNDGSSAFISAT